MTADSPAAASVTPAVDSITSGDSIDSGDGGGRSLTSPWAQVVRVGIESELISPAPAPATADSPVLVFSDPAVDGGDWNAGGGAVRSPWSTRAVNGVVEVVGEPVMGAAMWPALSESTRLQVKTVAGSSEVADPAAVAAAVDQAPLIIPQLPVKQVKPNHRQRSFKRGVVVSGAPAASAGFSRPLQPPGPALPPPFPLVDRYGNLVPVIPEQQQPQPPFKANAWSPRPVDQSMNRHPVRRNSFSPRLINNGYGGRREQHGPRPPLQVGPPPPPAYRGFVRQPVFLPHPIRPYGPPMGYEMGAPYVYVPTLAQVPYRGGAPVFPHGALVPSMPMAPTDSFLHDEIVKQIEYYFSDDNLVKDTYLRSHMDEEGWVPITLIAGFPKMQALTSDIQMLLSTLRDSNTVEIQGDKLRRRGDWKRWTRTPLEVTAASLQKLTLVDESTNIANGDVPCA